MEEQLKGPGQEFGRYEQPLWLESRSGRSKGQTGDGKTDHIRLVTVKDFGSYSMV